MLTREWGIGSIIRRLKKISNASIERQKRSQYLAPVLVLISGNSLVFSRTIIASTSFYRCCARGASVPVVVKNQSPNHGLGAKSASNDSRLVSAFFFFSRVKVYAAIICWT